MLPLAVTLASVFGGLAVLHLYWAFGGRWGAGAAVPTDVNGQPAFNPGAAACVVVAAGLAIFGYLCLARVERVPVPFAAGHLRWILLGMAALFVLRAIGDSRYVGVTRRITTSDFARRDRWLFTPLCWGLAASLVILTV